MDPRFAGLKYVFLDADDTLWHNDGYFRQAEDEFAEYLSRQGWCTVEQAKALMEVKQEENIPIYGYGSKTYLLGMLDTAADMGGERFGPQNYRDLKEIIRRLTTHPFGFIDEAEEVVKDLAARYKVVIATKGELCEQFRKYRMSGLADCVLAIEVMERKSPADYFNLAIKLGIDPSNFFMVGNSVRSDVAPVIEMGGWAVHIPYPVTWIHEVMDLPDSPRVIELQNIGQLRGLLL